MLKLPPATSGIDEGYMDRVANVIVDGLKFGRCQGVDPTPWTVSGAATFRTGAKDMNGNRMFSEDRSQSKSECLSSDDEDIASTVLQGDQECFACEHKACCLKKTTWSPRTFLIFVCVMYRFYNHFILL